jgi:hypothetical protein
MQSLQIAAFTLPVADGVIDELELAQTTEIRDRKNGAEYTFETGIFALLRQQVHLQKALIGSLLYLDKVGNWNRSLNLRKIDSLAERSI